MYPHHLAVTNKWYDIIYLNILDIPTYHWSFYSSKLQIYSMKLYLRCWDTSPLAADKTASFINTGHWRDSGGEGVLIFCASSFLAGTRSTLWLAAHGTSSWYLPHDPECDFPVNFPGKPLNKLLYHPVGHHSSLSRYNWISVLKGRSPLPDFFFNRNIFDI